MHSWGSLSAITTDCDAIYIVLSTSRTFIFSTLGFTAMAFTTGALAQWAPLFIQRVSNMISPDHGYGDYTYV